MALTAEVKRELARVEVTKTGVRKAEVSSMLRFSGGLHIIAGRIAVEAELDNSLSADRLRAAIADLYGFYSDIVISGASFNKHATKYIVRVLGDGESLARQTGLLDNRGRPVRGLPANLVNGSQEDTVAIWRGAFLARGSLTEPGRSATLEITCPGSESALALVGAARRLNVIAKAREVRNVDRVVIRDSDVIANLLDLLGAKITAAQWRDSRSGREARVGVNRLANFDDANLRRSAQAAVAAGARVARALQILGEEAPDHLRYAGQLRLEHKQASLDELGRLAEPQMTKDAIAGRIRRLLSMADKRARELGIQDTEVSVLAEGER